MTDYEADGSTLEYLVRDQWGTGFVADFALQVDEPVETWRISFQLDADIQDIWNARIVSRNGNTYTIEAAPWNAELAAGGTASFGFTAAGTNTTIDPATLTLNGQPATGEGGGGDPVVPAVALGDLTVTEGQDGSAAVPVTLSAPASGEVVLHYETYDLTATGGSDYLPASGTLTIPAGASGGTIQVALLDDALAEAPESFGIRITAVQGATLADAEAVVTVQDTDPPPAGPPRVSVADIAVAEPGADAGGGGATGLFAPGPLSTSGNQIVDATGAAVEIRAVNWFGMETDTFVPHGLWTRNWQDMMDQMKELGFNAIRLPFSGEMVLENPVPNSINYAQNPDLQGLTALEVMDRIVAHADELGMRVLLDHHRSHAGNGANESGLWYDGQYSEADWIGVWQTLAARYRGDDTIIGADLHNEPHGAASWGDGGATDWARAAEAAGNAIHQVAPDWLIAVEGIGGYGGESYWWGGALQGVREHPVELAQPGKLVYSPHDYPASVYAQDWFFDGSDLTEVFRNAWGYIYEEGIAPVLVGEFGSRLETAVDRAWAEAITGYMNGDLNGDGASDLAAGEGGISFAWWSWNPNSGDTGGILNDDWTSVRQDAVELLQPLLAEPAGGGEPLPDGGGVPEPVFATFTIGLDAPAAEALTLDYRTEDGTAQAWQDYLPEEGSLTFAAGEQYKTVSVEILADGEIEQDESFRLVLSGDGATGDFSATAIIAGDAGTPPGGGEPGGGEPGGGEPGGGGEDGLLASFSVRSDWGSGATVDLTLTNSGEAPIHGWQVAFDLPVEIQHAWNGIVEQADAERYRIANQVWNGEIAPGQSVTLGFNTSGGGLDPAALNAQANFSYLFG